MIRRLRSRSGCSGKSEGNRKFKKNSIVSLYRLKGRLHINNMRMYHAYICVCMRTCIERLIAFKILRFECWKATAATASNYAVVNQCTINLQLQWVDATAITAIIYGARLTSAMRPRMR